MSEAMAGQRPCAKAAEQTALNAMPHQRPFRSEPVRILLLFR